MLSASGRYDRKVKIRRKVTRKQRQHARLIVRTETRRLTLLRNLRWGVLRKPGPKARGDVTIEHHRRIWRRTAGYAVRLSAQTYLGGAKQCWGLVGVYKQRHGDRIRIVVGVHMPARVEYLLRVGRASRDTTAWMQALRALGCLVDNLRREHPAAEIVVTGDWNVCMRDGHFRALIAKELRLTAAAPVNAKGNRIPWFKVPGTHGRRVIDWAFTNTHALCAVLPITPASDHRPIDLIRIARRK